MYLTMNEPQPKQELAKWEISQWQISTKKHRQGESIKDIRNIGKWPIIHVTGVSEEETEKIGKEKKIQK